MEYTKLGNTDVKVSKICLGTMTWGEQNSEPEAHEQMDYALERGVNFFDVAEMYPVPRNDKTQGRTEEYIGTWFQKSGNRDKVILATKVAGPDDTLLSIRNPLGFGKDQIHDAVNKSLARLQTDYIDLYQLHWPERDTNRFGVRYTPHDEAWEDNFNDILTTLDGLIKEGKIRHVGLSNELPWGIMRYLQESRDHDLPRMQSIQNAYSLINRTFEYALSEVAIREDIGLLAYSPLAFGMLSGKYNSGADVTKARLTLYPQFLRYRKEAAKTATAAYMEVAKKHGLNMTKMALAFVNTRPFITSNIVGATTLEQLKENIDSIDVELNKEVLTDINKVAELHPDPAP